MDDWRWDRLWESNGEGGWGRMGCGRVCVGKIALQDQAALRGTDRGERDCISSNPNWKGQEDHGTLG